MEEEKKKPKVVKRLGLGCLGLIVLFILIGALAGGSSDKTTEQSQSTSNQEQTTETTNTSTKTEPTATTENKQPSVPAEYKSALSQATTYANTMNLSKQGVYDQLVSEYGGKFSAEAAKYAIDNVKADWNANALAQAKTYQDTMHLSPTAVRDQLVSQYGGKFTATEADYAIQHLND